MHELIVTIQTTSPAVIAAQSGAAVLTASRDSFSGAVLRGILAQRYIELHQLRDKAHEDAYFRSLFLEKLRFLAAMPVKRKKRSFVLPLSLQKDKTGNHIIDGLVEAPPENQVYKSCRGMAVIDNGMVYQTDVQKTIFLHMSRSSEQERISGKSEDGNIYNYEAILAGQKFEGAVYGSKADLEMLVQLAQLTKPYRVYLGRSKYTQYGRCTLSFSGIREIQNVNAGSDQKTVYIRLDSPLLSTHAQADSVMAFVQPFLTELEEKFSIHVGLVPEKTFAAAEDVHNFVGVWGLPRPVQHALSAGSVFALQKQEGNWTKDELLYMQKRMHEGIGSRVSEGFGQLRFWLPEALRMAERGIHKEKRTVEITSPEVRQLAERILMKKIIAAVRKAAYDDASGAVGTAGKAHMFARIENELAGRRPSMELVNTFGRGMISNDRTVDTQFEKNLKGVRIPDKGTVYDLLMEEDRRNPYNSVNWQEELPQQAFDMMDAIDFDKRIIQDTDTPDPRLFMEYWKWFARHGRKRAVRSKEEE